MSVVLTSIVPLFAVVFLGYFAGRARFLSEAGVRALVAFVFNFAMPPFLFRLMADTDLTEIAQWGFLGVYSLAALAMFVVGSVAGALFGLRPAGVIIQGFGSAFANGVLLGLPLLLWLYGEAGAVPALLIITLDVVLFGVVTLLLEVARSGRAAGAGHMAGQTLRAIALNPIIMATFMGILFGLSGAALPDVVDRTLGFIGQAGPPTALFALGATLSLRRIAGNLARPASWSPASCSCIPSWSGCW